MVTKKNYVGKENDFVKIVVRSLILLLFVLLFSLNVFALTINVNSSFSVEENSSLVVPINLLNVSGVSFVSIAPNDKGVINKVNDSYYEFSWAPLIGDAGIDNINSFRNYVFLISSNDSSSSISSQFTVKVTKKNIPPVIVVSGNNNPGLDVRFVNVSVESNVPGICKYDLSDKSYSNMAYTMVHSDSSKLLHQGITPGLKDGLNNVYILCKDFNENYMLSSYVWSVFVSLRPEAQVSLEPSSPLKSGFVKVRIKTSVDLISAPLVKYYFNDDVSEKAITMVGSGNSWEGYIIIDESDKRRIGTFTFKGTGINNLEGTYISSGKIFIVDTFVPVKVSSIVVSNHENSLRLDWTYLEDDSDNIKEYRIYRRVGRGGVEYTDYLTKTSGSYYVDSDVEFNEAYYYRISAVNHADKEGELSKEVFITRVPLVENVSQKSLDPLLVYELNEHVVEVDRLILEVSSIKNRLERLNGEGTFDVMQSLSIVGKLNSALDKLNKIKVDLNALKSRDLSRSEFVLLTDSLLSDANKAYFAVPKNVVLKDSLSFQEYVDDYKTLLVANAYLEHLKVENSNAKDINVYLDQVKLLQDKILVQSQVYKVEVTYSDNKVEDYFVVKKTISGSGIVDDVLLFEYLPDNVNNFYFVETPVIIEDNLFYWSSRPFTNKKVTYTFMSGNELQDFNDLKTLIFVNFVGSQDKVPGITGKVTGNDGFVAHPLFWPLVFGVLISVILTGYYFAYTEINNNKSDSNFFYSFIMKLRRRVDERRLNIIPRSVNDSHRKLDLISDDYHPSAKIDVDVSVVNNSINSYDNVVNSDVINKSGNVNNINFNDVKNVKNDINFKRGSLDDKLNSVNVDSDDAVFSAYVEEHFDDVDVVKKNNDFVGNFVNDNYNDPDDSDDSDNYDDSDDSDGTDNSNVNYDVDVFVGSSSDSSNSSDSVSSNVSVSSKKVVDSTKINSSKVKKSSDNDLVADITLFRERLKDYASNIDSVDLSSDKVKDLHNALDEINFLCQDISSKNLRGFVDKAKHELEEVLKYIDHKKFLDVNASPGKEFVLCNGKILFSVKDLLLILPGMDDLVFYHHVSNHKNDFAVWIRHVFSNESLADKVSKVKNKQELIDLLSLK